MVKKATKVNARKERKANIKAKKVILTLNNMEKSVKNMKAKENMKIIIINNNNTAINKDNNILVKMRMKEIIPNVNNIIIKKRKRTR